MFQPPQGRLIHTRQSATQTLSVYQHAQLRLLRVDDLAIQSACDLQAPHRLCLPYSQMMMGVFLFQPAPEMILLLGLGGGDMVRYLHHTLPRCRMDCVDIDPDVIDIAQHYFGLPSSRVNLTCDDAGRFIQSSHTTYDTIFVDIYAPRAQLLRLYNWDFFDHCHQQLNRGGVLSLNLVTEDAALFQSILCKIRECFNYLSVCAKVAGHNNVIIFAFKTKPAEISHAGLLAKTQQLSRQYELDFNPTINALFKTNPLKSGEFII